MFLSESSVDLAKPSFFLLFHPILHKKWGNKNSEKLKAHGKVSQICRSVLLAQSMNVNISPIMVMCFVRNSLCSASFGHHHNQEKRNLIKSVWIFAMSLSQFDYIALVDYHKSMVSVTDRRLLYAIFSNELWERMCH